MSAEPLPVTVIGGYLGAGKTTLVNHLLRHAGGRRLAVLVNEFGDLPIDADLIEAEEGNLISIAGGCICCSFGDDLTAALRDLAALDPAPDHVLIESSGVAMPGGILLTVSLLETFRADGVVVVADAGTVRTAHDDAYIGDTIRRQLQAADIVVLSKVDLLDGDTGGLRDWLSGITPGAIVEGIVGAREGAVAPDLLLGLGGAALGADGGSGPDTAHSDALFDSVTLHPGACDVHALAGQIVSGGFGVVRAKGHLRDANGVMRLVHLVGSRVEVTEGRDDRPEGLVCIGLRGQFDRAGLLDLAAAPIRRQSAG